jgi:hypothetical protein
MNGSGWSYDLGALLREEETEPLNSYGYSLTDDEGSGFGDGLVNDGLPIGAYGSISINGEGFSDLGD